MRFYQMDLRIILILPLISLPGRNMMGMQVLPIQLVVQHSLIRDIPVPLLFSILQVVLLPWQELL